MSQIYLTDKAALAYFEKKSTPQFWDQHWEIEDLRKYLLSCTSEGLFFPYVKKYLPQESRILEGGCGRGQIVNALKHHGYNSVGIDFAEKTVRKVNEAVPELDVRLGDVRNLPFDNSEFDGYISSGVIEHFWDGYDDILSEMSRVLRKGGFLFVSFPYMSTIRKIKATVGSYPHKSSCEVERESDDFYQFALDYENVLEDFKKFGFVSRHIMSFGGIKGFKDELTWFKPFLQPIYDGRILQIIRPLLEIIFRPLASHCTLLVMEKETKS